MNLLTSHLREIKQLCDDNKVSRLFAFGSVTTDQMGKESDIDFVVDIIDSDPLSYSDKYFDLKQQLEKLFKRKIDLLEQKSIRNPFLAAQIEKTKVLVYGK